MLEDSTACSHPAWRYPNPHPYDGDECPDCGARHTRPWWMQPVPRDQMWLIDWLRTLAELHAWTVESRTRQVAPERASVARKRIARVAGWQYDPPNDAGLRDLETRIGTFLVFALTSVGVTPDLWDVEPPPTYTRSASSFRRSTHGD